MTDIPAGWPCAGLAAVPPSVADLEAQPTADDLLPQILPLAPRGPAWGTDEAGDGTGASPVQRRFWRAFAAFAADHLGLDWLAATQTFPSAITYTLPDWETELGLPDPCVNATLDVPTRVAAVRARFGALGGSSPAYFVCLAKSLGYAVTIEEPTQFRCDVSACAADLVEVGFACDGGQCDRDPLERVILAPATLGGDPVAGGLTETGFACDQGQCDRDAIDNVVLDNPYGTMSKLWRVVVPSLGTTAFACDGGQCDRDPVEGVVRALDLECELRRLDPPHMQLVVAYR